MALTPRQAKLKQANTEYSAALAARLTSKMPKPQHRPKVVALKGFEPDGFDDAYTWAEEHHKDFGFLLEFLDRVGDLDIPSILNKGYVAYLESEDGTWLFTQEEYNEIVRRARHYQR